jgi:tetratricopeptide (TPR) repeat protein
MDENRLPQPNENNLWYRYNDRDAVLVFVHGVLSDSRGCWLYEDDETKKPVSYWPDLIESDVRFKEVGIYLAGYHTAVDSGDFPIQQCAQQVYAYLKTQDPESRQPVMDKQKIIFVAHSMGGIVARYLLCEQREAFKGKQVGIVLIASPSYGSQLASSLDEVIYHYNHEQGKQLKWGNAILKDLDQRFKNLKESGQMPRLFGVEFFENRFMIRWKWLPLFARTKIVTEESAARYFGYAKQIGGSDHSSICKPKTAADLVHQYLLEFLQDKDLLPSQVTIAPPTDGAALPAVHPEPAGRGAPLAFSTGLSTQTFWITHGAGGVSLQTAPPFALGPQPTQWASQLSMMLADPSSPALTQAVQEKPRLEELFEVISDPEVIPKALYQTEQSTGLAPYDADYCNARENVSDIQEALETALRVAKGRLLIRGPRGTGKTREIAELARNACAAKWQILIARNEGNPRLGPLLMIPPELIDARLLIIIDNLHLRISTGAEQPTPYMERLERLLEWFERQLPGNVRVVAIARDEPRYLTDLGLPQGQEKWHGFSVFRLPGLTDDGLRNMLAALAARAQVSVAAGDIAKLVENSDRKPATVFINVDRARQKRVALTPALWTPTEGEPWRLRFADARADHAGVDHVCHALGLLAQAGLPTRIPYVIAVARALGEPQPQAVVLALVGESLLRMRHEILTPFSAEQLQDLLGHDAESAVKPERLADTIERAITDNRPQEWADDLLAFALGLLRSGSMEQAEQAASRAVELAAGGSRAYRVRAAVRFERRDLPGVHADLTMAIEMGDSDADTYFGRAAIRNLLGNFAGAIVDLDLAMGLGRDDAALHVQRGTAYYMQARWGEANSAMSAAIERGENSAMNFFARGMVRFQLKDALGATQDLSAAIDRGVDLNEAADNLRRISQTSAAPPASGRADGPGSGKPLAHLFRSLAHFNLGNTPAAEEDLTVAIAGGAGAYFNAFVDALSQSTLPMMVEANRKLRDITVPLSEGLLYHLRAVARLDQNKLTAADADFGEAIARDYVEGETYFGRATARLRMGQQKWVDAEADLTAALGQRVEAQWLFSRGCVRFDLGRYEQAEQDLTAALQIKCEHPALFTIRGLARLMQNKLSEADQDAAAAFDRGATDVHAYSLRAAVRLVQERYAEAEPDLTAALELGRRDAWVLFHRGRARQKLDRYAEAERDYDEAIACGKAAAVSVGIGVDDLHAERGHARLRQQKWPGAVEDFAAAIAAGCDNAYVHFCLGHAHQKQHHYAQAETAYDFAIARDNRPDYRTVRGELRLIRGNFHGAACDYSVTIADNSADAYAFFRRGFSRYGLSSHIAALADFDAALALAPGDIPVLGARVMANLRLGDIDGASKDCEQLEALDRDGAETRGCQGALALARGRFEVAFERFTAAAQVDSGWYFWQGMMLLLTERFDEAREAYSKAIDQNTPGDNLIARDELAFYLGRHPNRTSSRQAQSALAFIRTRLSPAS